MELQVWRDSIDWLITAAARALGADGPLGAPRRRTHPQAHRPGEWMAFLDQLGALLAATDADG
jgi:hypothetical protein